MRPWKWCPDEHCWIREADNHVPLARVRPPQPGRATANCTVYLQTGIVGVNVGDLQAGARWCDEQLVSQNYKFRVSEQPIPKNEMHKGFSWLWLHTKPSRV
jgi:hypothetical protein